MMKSKLCIAALALFAVSLGIVSANAQAYAPAYNFYTAGSSAQFNTFGIAASYTIPPAGYPLCGGNHWSQKSGSASPSGSAAVTITIVDPRSNSILAEPANVWIAWDNAAAAKTPGAGVVCFFAAVDSIVGVRAYMANAYLSLSSNAVGHADASPDLVPLIGQGQPLPQAIYDIVNGAVINAANTDIRAEDAKFATMRVLTPLGQQVTGRAATGLGYGPGTIGTAIFSSYSGAKANPVDFAIDGQPTNGQAIDVDPINANNPIREFFDLPIGAAPVMVIANVSAVGNGHLGDGNYTNINRFILARALEGKLTRVRDLGYNAPYPVTGTPSEASVPLNVYIREPLSGTYNTMEWSVPNALEIDASTWQPGQVNGQETGVNPSLTTNCTTGPCALENGNPFFHIAANGAARGRAIGTGEMVNAVNTKADTIGYAFWGFSNFQGKGNLKYLTVDGVDPLFAVSNPNGVGVLPSCTLTVGYATSCPNLTFPNIVNGSYPIWSKYRMMWDPFTASSNLATAITAYAQAASDPGTGVITDMLPVKYMQTFHSHYAQVVRDNGTGYSPNNGFKAGIPEYGGDMGGAILTIQSELDYIADTNNQQVGLVE